MKILIIDDEEKARVLLQNILQETCNEIVREIYLAADLEEGVEIIKKKQIEVVFLDIEMPRYSGLEILNFFKDQSVDFHIVITTAYEEYAVKAFKMSAVDYILKPINVNDVQRVIQKVNKLINVHNIESKIENIETTLHQITVDSIALEVPKGIIFVDYNDILYFEADRMYSKVYMKDGSVDLISKPLRHFIDQLESNIYFFRSHRSYLINLKHVKSFVKEEGGYLLMKNNKTLPISKEKKEEFLNIVQIVFGVRKPKTSIGK